MSATRGTEPAGDAGTSARTERWRVLVPYLDRALELEGEDRSAWLQELRAEDEALAAEVDALLERHHTLRAERFLDGGPLVRPAVSLAGQVLGAYRLVSRIGQGGMGTVWRADRCDGRFRGQAAVKILNASLVGRDGEQRFRREGSILARLRHPHIARLIDAGVSLQGQPYLVLEHVQGEHLDAYCDTRRMGVEARLRLFLDVLSAVANAHANLVVHRDLKPSNVLVDADGQVKLLDFGIAKLLEDDADVVAVVTRETPMTPAYAAPEQLTGGDVTTATDVYALGALLYVLLVGRHPARDPAISPAELVRAVVDADAAPPSEVALAGPSTLERAGERGTTPARLRKALRGDLDNIVAKALKKRPGERYASVEAMADDLRRHLAHEPVSARPDSIRYRAARFLRRHRLGVAAAAVVVASLAAGLGATAWQAARARRAAARAQAVTEFVVGLFELSNPSRPQSEQVTARQLLDRGVQRLDADLQDQPELRASLLGVLGRVHASLGLYDQAADLLGRSEALISRHRPGDDAERARILSELADVRRSSSDYVQAAKLAREALAIQKRVHGGDHADTAMMLDRLGGVLSDQGQRAEAASAYREALAMRRRLHGDTHREVVASLNHVAGVLFEDGDYAGAEATYREALTIARSLPGDSYPSVPWSMGNVAAALYKRGKAAEAEVLLRESLRLFRERLGNRHPELTPFLRHLATALRAQGKMREATSFYEETLSIQREVYGDAHHEVAKTTHDLATLLHTQGRLREAEARHRECLQILRQLLPPNHPHLGRAMAGLARVRADQGEHAEAEALFREAVAILEKGLAPGHPLTAEARAGLDRAVLAQHRRLASASAGRGR